MPDDPRRPEPSRPAGDTPRQWADVEARLDYAIKQRARLTRLRREREQRRIFEIVGMSNAGIAIRDGRTHGDTFVVSPHEPNDWSRYAPLIRDLDLCEFLPFT